MANKTVENPCMGTGLDTYGDLTIIKGKTYAKCSVCHKDVSVNKGNKLARKHSGAYQRTLWELYEEFEREQEPVEA